MQNAALIILDSIADWQPYYPSQSIISASDYLLEQDAKARAQILNLCGDLSYLSTGYYVSLLAEARGQRVLPSVSTINDLANFSHYQLLLPASTDKQISRYLTQQTESQRQRVLICFGQTQDPLLASFARQIFDRYPCPILWVEFSYQGRWFIHNLIAGNLAELTDEQQTFFGDSLDSFSKRVWRKARAKKEYRYDLAILHDPEEPIPTSDKKALQKFIKAAKEADIDAELITADDYNRLLEFDALFIRETTRISHYTYHFAKKAEANGMVVIDAPHSILQCANKVFLKELLDKHRIPTPRTELILSQQDIDYEAIGERLGYPVVLKIPDGSFSIGVEKAESIDELKSIAADLFKTSTILLAQEFVRTEFDWRIGILNNRAIYACKYYMARNHWQIYNHASATSRSKSGGFETVGIHQVPKDVVKTALQATRLIGDGLYGVDMKLTAQGPVIIEINDNPSIDAGVEDLLLGDELYHIIMRDFARRLDEK
ncbi:RimK family protein [Pseudidiomarina terrestris]|uniref:RimK family protein n=1 Tax=Pseudidiomarina terrestris TaxID=2820060 RepID=A0AAW7R1J0_9GAMM|nr:MULTISPECIES: RimK family protein [unclassified Pseudidiomarina]MDN7125168.1 RimK family protein [Pseudidiomarina sp. 1APP75-32.1]MDN7127429.1 RimK family protein [Pseudidiomarina sp. 1APR75-33.1]MDN7129929.1 RimK family protein [Pseudidiomarina sp. 1APR75-15]MDN7136095.1 RimK family protein [Pseudidiomarina sp. 1ASP75-5]MDN7138380.1 RimK family protein [Pseudidiomarina sp. 1ASP75-14]